MARSVEKDNIILTDYDLSEAPVLNLGSPLQRLREGEASIVEDLDILTPSALKTSLRPAPVGVDLPPGLINAWGVSDAGLIVSRESGVIQPRLLHSFTTPTYDTGTGNVTLSGVNTGTPFFDASTEDKLFIRNFGVFDIDPSQGSYPAGPDTAVHIGGGLPLPASLSGAIIFSPEMEFYFAQNLLSEAGPSSGLPMSLLRRSGEWDTSLVGGYVVLGDDLRNYDTAYYTIASIASFARPNDTLRLSGREIAMAANDQKYGFWKFEVIGAKRFSLKGVLSTDGRRLHLTTNMGTTLVHDFGSGYEGTRWELSRLSFNRFLLVSPTRRPHVLYLDGRVLPAGLFPPRPDYARISQSTDQRQGVAWLANVATQGTDLGGSLTQGTKLKVMVRLVNLQDAVYSDFVPVLLQHSSDEDGGLDAVPNEAADNAVFEIPITAGNKGVIISPSSGTDRRTDKLTGHHPPVETRATHLEVWRTLSASGGVFYLESRILLADPARNERVNDAQDLDAYYAIVNQTNKGVPAGASPGTDEILQRLPVSLSDTSLPGLPVLTISEEESSGGLPPICRRSVSLSGVTLCFGRAGDDRTNPRVIIRKTCFRKGRYNPTTGVLDNPGANLNLRHEVRPDSKLVILRGGSTSAPLYSFPLGEYSLVDDLGLTVGDYHALTLPLPTGLVPGSNTCDNIVGYLEFTEEVSWPAIETDEDVWYSRTDVFQPENFPPRVLNLSRTGDTFRNAVLVGKYVVVIMDQGVHLLYLSGVTLVPVEIESNSAGTPWEDSVVVLGKTVFWATPNGVRSLVTSNETNEQGDLAVIAEVFGDRLKSWFRKAYDEGYTVDGGYDPLNQVLRWRRVRGDDSEAVQICLRTQRVSIAPNDPGDFHVVTDVFGGRNRLYSVSRAGGLFEVFPNDPAVVTGDTSTHSIGPAAVMGPGLAHRHGDYILLQPGDILRKIRTSDMASITFDPVDPTGLTSFTIGQSRLRIRYAPMRGVKPEATKTVEEITLRALGTGQVTLRLLASDGTQGSQDVPLGDDAGLKPSSRVSSLVKASPSLEAEISSSDDLDLDVMLVRLREET